MWAWPREATGKLGGAKFGVEGGEPPEICKQSQEGCLSGVTLTARPTGSKVQGTASPCVPLFLSPYGLLLALCMQEAEGMMPLMGAILTSLVGSDQIEKGRWWLWRTHRVTLPREGSGA